MITEHPHLIYISDRGVMVSVYRPPIDPAGLMIVLERMTRPAAERYHLGSDPGIRQFIASENTDDVGLLEIGSIIADTLGDPGQAAWCTNQLQEFRDKYLATENA